MGCMGSNLNRKSTAGMTAEQRAEFYAEEERKKFYEPTPELTAFCDLLRITPQKCQELYEVFRIIDIDGSGSVEPIEMYTWLHEEKSLFVDNLGPLVGLEKGAPIFFYDFVRITAIFCFFDDKEIVKFAFDSFDEFQAGGLTVLQLAKALHLVARSALNVTASVHEILESIDEECDPFIDFEEFMNFHVKFPKILWPVFRLQHRLRYQTLGIDYWRDQQFVLFGLRQSRTVNQLALVNERKAAEMEERIQQSRDPETGEVRVPISTRRIGSLGRSVLVEAPQDRPVEFFKAYKRTTMYMDDSAAPNRVSLATQSLYRNASQLRTRALGLRREELFAVSDFTGGINRG